MRWFSLFAALSLSPVLSAQALLPSDMEDATQRDDAIYAAKASFAPMPKEITPGCTTTPLPTTPEGQTWTVDINDVIARYRVTVWRKPCSAQDAQLLVTLTPTAGPTRVDAPFGIAQGSRQFNLTPVTSASGTGFNGALNQTTTVMFQPSAFSSSTFDDDQALRLSIITLFIPTVTIDIPALTTSGPPTFTIDNRVRGLFSFDGAVAQGLSFDLIEGTAPLLAAGWYTASPDPARPDQHEWYVLVGPINGDSATLDIQHTRGQTFMGNATATTTSVGSATVRFTSCTQGTFTYTIPAFNKQGTFPIRRATPPPAGCQ